MLIIGVVTHISPKMPKESTAVLEILTMVKVISNTRQTQ